MMINSRAANFQFIFPKGFFTKDTVDKYDQYIKRLLIPYDTLANYMSSTIQSMTFPSLNMDPVTQTRNLGKKQEYKNSVPIPDLFTREIDVTFKTIDGYINYWIFLNNIIDYLNFDNPRVYVDDLIVRFLDQTGMVITSVVFKGVYFKSLSELQMSYSDNNPDFKTFTSTFGFFSMDIIIEKD